MKINSKFLTKLNEAQIKLDEAYPAELKFLEELAKKFSELKLSIFKMGNDGENCFIDTKGFFKEKLIKTNTAVMFDPAGIGGRSITVEFKSANKDVVDKSADKIVVKSNGSTIKNKFAVRFEKTFTNFEDAKKALNSIYAEYEGFCKNEKKYCEAMKSTFDKFDSDRKKALVDVSDAVFRDELA